MSYADGAGSSSRRAGDDLVRPRAIRNPRRVVVVAALVGMALSTSCRRPEDAVGGRATHRESPSVGARVFPDSEGRPFLGARVVTAVDARGGMAVADKYEDRLVLLDSAGTPKGTVGRSGQGPGEFDYVAAIVRLPVGFAVWDMFQGRLEVYDDDWRLVRTIRVPFLGGEQAVPLGDGVGVIVVRPSLSVVWTTDLTEDAEPTWRAIELSPILGPRPEVGEQRVPVIGGSRDGHLLVGWGHGSYLIHAVDTAGAELFTFGREMDPPLRGEVDLERIEKRRARLGSLGVGSGQSEDPYPFNPHYRSIKEDACHRLWVGTYRGTDSTTVADVFDHDGHFLDEAIMPGRGRLDDVTGTHAYLVVEDRDDVSGIEVVHLGRFGCPPGDAIRP